MMKAQQLLKAPILLTLVKRSREKVISVSRETLISCFLGFYESRLSYIWILHTQLSGKLDCVPLGHLPLESQDALPYQCTNIGTVSPLREDPLCQSRFQDDPAHVNSNQWYIGPFLKITSTNNDIQWSEGDLLSEVKVSFLFSKSNGHNRCSCSS